MAQEENYIGIAMGLDVTDLKSGLSEANKQIQLANSEFKRASSGMEDWTKSTEGLNAKIIQLSTVFDMQKKKLAGLEAEYEKVSKSQGENSEAARRLKVQINNQTSIVNKTERELNNYKETLDGVKKGTVDLEKVSLRSGKAISKTGQDAKKASGGFTVLKGAISGVIANGFSKLVGACKNAFSSLMNLTESTKEFRTVMASLELSSKKAGYSTKETAQTFEQLNGVLGDTQKSATTTANLQALGLEQNKLKEITNGVIGAWAQYGDSIPIDGLSEAVNETVKVGKVTGTFADVLTWAGMSEDEFNDKLANCSDETERANLVAEIFAKQGLTKTGEAWQKNNKNIVDANNAQQHYEKSTADLADKLSQILNSIREGWAKVLDKVLELTNGVDFEALGQRISDAFDDFINNVLPKILDGLQWIIDNKDILIAGIAGIGAALLTMNVAKMIMGVVSAFKAFKAAQEGVTIAQWLLNIAMSANPIGLVATAIGILVTAFIVLWNKSEAFRNFWKGLWEQIKKYAAPVIDYIKTAFSLAWEVIKGVWSVAGSFFKATWNNIKAVFSVVKSVLTGDFKGAWEGIKEVFSFSKVKQFFNEVKEKIVSAFDNIKDKFPEVGKNILKGIWEGIKNGAKWLKDKITGFAGDVADWFKKTFKINSPSKLMADEVGKYIGEGVGVGVVDSIPNVKKNLSKFTGFVTDNLGNIKGGLSSMNNNAVSGSSAASKVITNNNGLTINYNGNLSRKEVRKLEDDYYRSVKLKLKSEGLV